MCMSTLPISLYIMCAIPVEVRRRCQIPGTEVIDGYELPYGCGNQTWVLCKRSQQS